MLKGHWLILFCGILLTTGCKKNEQPDSAEATPEEVTPSKAVKVDNNVEKEPPKAVETAKEEAAVEAPKEEGAAEAPKGDVATDPKEEVAMTESTDEAEKQADSAGTGASGVADAEEAAAPSAGSPDAVPSIETPYLAKREGALQIAKLVLSRGVEKNEDNKRVPVEPGNSFIRDERRVFAILDLENPMETESELKVGWIRPGTAKETGIVPLTVKAKKTWKTWAFNKRVNKDAGIWQVVIRDSDDTILARAAFEMKE